MTKHAIRKIRYDYDVAAACSLSTPATTEYYRPASLIGAVNRLLLLLKDACSLDEDGEQRCADYRKCSPLSAAVPITDPQKKSGTSQQIRAYSRQIYRDIAAFHTEHAAAASKSLNFFCLSFSFLTVV